MYTTPNMGLKAWDQETDPYDHQQLVDNWVKVDQHDHTDGRGAPLPIGAIPILGQANLGPCSVGVTQLCNNAVVNSKIASSAVKSPNIADDAVTQPAIAGGSVGTDELQPNSVEGTRLADGSVSTSKIVDGSVLNSKIANGSVSELKIGTGAVSSPKIAPSAVGSGQIDDLAVTGPKIAAGAVNGPKISSQAIRAPQLGSVPSVYLTIQGTQAIQHNNPTRIEWDIARYISIGDILWTGPGSHQITIQTEGLYLIEACVFYEDGNPGAGTSGRMAKIRRNNIPLTGCGPLTTLPDAPNGPFRVRLPMVTVLHCYPGDDLDVQTVQTSGHNQNIIPDGLNTHFSATFLAAAP